jgi:hypothetical protein
VQAGEACDDGNQNEADSCSADCRESRPRLATASFTEFATNGVPRFQGLLEFYEPFGAQLTCGTATATATRFDVTAERYEDRVSVRLALCDAGRVYLVAFTLAKPDKAPADQFETRALQVAEFASLDASPSATWTSSGARVTVASTSEDGAGFVTSLVGDLALNATGTGGASLRMLGRVNVERLARQGQ